MFTDFKNLTTSKHNKQFDRTAYCQQGVYFPKGEKEKELQNLMIAHKELLIQNKGKEIVAKELIIANKNLSFHNK